MSREKKFRVRDKEKKFIYRVIQIDFEGQEIKVNTGHWLRNENKGDGVMVMDGERFVVMQYTGLKDKRGKEIYEGDIVLKDNAIKGNLLIVERCNTGRAVTEKRQYKDGGRTTGSTLDICSIIGQSFYGEIIGNIHENPELIN